MIQIAFVAASGPALLDCHILASRFDPESRAEGALEFMIVQSRDGTFSARRLGNYNDLWRSPSGTLYTVLEDHISWCPDAASGKNDWHVEPTRGLVREVSGVGEDLVFAYGFGESVPVYRLDGGRWVTDPAPGWLLAIHGTDPSLVYGVGREGLISRWDGAKWSPIPTNTTGVFKDVFVASPDQMYAIHEGGLWEGSVSGWAPRLSTRDNDLLSVSVWRDRVWVASRSRGLCTLDGAGLTVVKDNQMPGGMDARGALLMTQHDKVAGTSDGTNFQAWKLEGLADLWAQQRAPHWL